MAGIGIVTNPRSRHNLRHPEEARRLAYVLGDAGTCRETRTFEDVEAVAEEFRRRGIEILGLNGGDGTNHVTLTAFIKAYGDAPLPKIAFLKGGTMNSIAKSCGIRGNPASILRNLVDKYHRGEPFETVRRWTIKVAGERYGFIVGLGVIPSFIQRFHEVERPGPGRAASLLAQAVGSATVGGRLARELGRRVHARVTADGRTFEHTDFLAIGAGTLHYVGLGFTLFHRAYERKGAFHLFGVHSPTRLVVAEMPRLLVGRGFTPAVAEEDVVAAATIVADAPFPYIIDGDLYHSESRLDLEIGPSLEVLVR